MFVFCAALPIQRFCFEIAIRAEQMSLVCFSFSLGDVEHNCALCVSKLTDDPRAMVEIARGSFKECVRFAEAKLTPVQAAAAYAALRCAVAEHMLTQAAAVGGVGDQHPKAQMEEILAAQCNWLQTACDALGSPVSIEEAGKRIAWMRERIFGIHVSG